MQRSKRSRTGRFETTWACGNTTVLKHRKRSKTVPFRNGSAVLERLAFWNGLPFWNGPFQDGAPRSETAPVSKRAKRFVMGGPVPCSTAALATLRVIQGGSGIALSYLHSRSSKHTTQIIFVFRCSYLRFAVGRNAGAIMLVSS